MNIRKVNVKSLKSVADRRRRIREKEKRWRHKIAVLSGKGGVGKTTVAVNMAIALARKGYRVGLLDADIHGPDVAKMLGIDSPKLSAEKMEDHSELIPPEVDLGYKITPMKVITLGFLVEEDQPIIWRGPVIMKAIWQLLGDVKWGELDFFIVDFPPGTGDEILTVVQSMDVDASIIITTPQEVSLLDCGKAINFMKKMKIPYIAVTENMSYLICPHCGSRIDLFGRGGGRRLAKKEGVDFLGEIPFDLNARELCDRGRPVVLDKDSLAGKALLEVVNKLERRCLRISEMEDKQLNQLN